MILSPLVVVSSCSAATCLQPKALLSINGALFGPGAANGIDLRTGHDIARPVVTPHALRGLQTQRRVEDRETVHLSGYSPRDVLHAERNRDGERARLSRRSTEPQQGSVS